ncbi:MAG: GNAT family N-acetyltransferase [Firmicutes bacterium]|nr:GNAT family N-acetyltransferase [Bacillota bacterium]
MKIAFRTALNDDIPAIIKLQEKRKTFPCYVGYETVDEQRQRVVEFYKNLDLEGSIEPQGRLRLIMAENEKTDKLVGYMLVEVAQSECFGLFRRTHILDWHVALKSEWDYVMDEFIYYTEEFAISEGCRDIAIQVPIAFTEDEELLRELDFYPEMDRIMKPVEVNSLETNMAKRYKIRKADESDRLFMLSLSSGNADAIIPPGMESLTDEIKEAYFNLYAGLGIENNELLNVYIVEDPKEYRPVGFIIIMPNPESIISAKTTGYIYDLSVHNEYWGKYASQRIMREAENMLAEQNCGYYIGDISVMNPRATRTAIRTLNFKLWGRKWIKNVTGLLPED